MKHYIIKLAIFIVLIVCCPVFSAEGPSMKELYQQGQSFMKEGRHRDAVSRFAAGQKQAREKGDKKAYMAFSALLGQAYEGMGHLAESSAGYEQSANTAVELGDHPMAVQLFSQLGELYERQKLWKKAADAFEKSLNSAVALKDPAEMYNQAVSCAFALEKEKMFDKALQMFERALKAAGEMKDAGKTTAVTGSIAHTYLQMGRLNESVEWYEKAIALASERGDVKYASFYRGSLGAAYMDKGFIAKAMPLFNQAAQGSLLSGDDDSAAIWLKSLAHCRFSSGDPEGALGTYREIEKLARRTSNSPLLIYGLEMQGKTLSDMGDYQKAEEILTAAEKEATAQNDGGGLIRVLERLGYARQRRGQYEESEKYYMQALQLAKAPEFAVQRAEILMTMGQLKNETGQYQKSLQYCDEALKIAGELKNASFQNLIIASKVQTYGAMGKFWKGVETLHHAQKKAQAENDQYTRAQRLGDLGGLFLKIEELGQARKYFEEALLISVAIDDLSGVATFASAMGQIYQREGNPEKAEICYAQMLKTGRMLKNARIQLAALTSLSRICAERKDFTGARHHLSEALSLAQSSGDSWALGAVQRDMASLLIKMGKYDEAVENLDRLLAGHKDDQNPMNRVITLCFKGDAFRAKGDLKQGVDFYRQALSMVEKGKEPKTALDLKVRLGFISYHDLKDPDGALVYLYGAIDDIESFLEELKLDELKGRTVSRASELYELAVQILMERGMAEKALEYSERGRARDFLDSLKNTPALPAGASGSPLAMKEARLSDNIKALQKKLETSPWDQRDALWREQEKLKEEYLETVKSLKLENPEYVSFKTVATATAEEMRKSLSPDEVMLNYYVTGGKTFLFVITTSEIKAFTLNGSRKTLDGLVGIARKSIENSRKNPKRADESLGNLYRILLEPAAAIITGRKTVIVVPHGPLHYLPFAALKSPDGKYLLETHRIITEPSGSAFVLLRKRPVKTSGSLGAFALADVSVPKASVEMTAGQNVFTGAPLPGTGREVELIKNAFSKSGRKARSYAGKEFTQKRAEEVSSHCGYLHFATHGFISPDGRGSFSGLVTSDGFIYVSDVFGWRLNARLAVLSACQTGIGSISRGDDMVGLSRAFMQAGADNLVATLWSVEDQSTSLLMADFYQRILKGEPLPEALGRSQLSLIKTHPEPFYWAPFVLFGR